MRWQGREESSNIEDRRGSRSFGFGSGGGLPLFQGKAGIVVLLVVLVAGYYGVDLTPFLTGESQEATSSYSETYTPSPQEMNEARFTSVALKLTEDTWTQIFEKMGKEYTPPKLVLYSRSTQTSCGYGQSVMGPFYCPRDKTVYIDLSFYQDMKRKLGGGGDFAQGYVIAHEVGHHVQNLLGIESQVRQLQQGASEKQVNNLSVKLELQADCFAGIWGNAVEKMGILDSGDVEEALNTAQAIGDDRLQQSSSGRVVPDSFTHGTSEQRYTWFKRGYTSGEVNMCNTFKEF